MTTSTTIPLVLARLVTLFTAALPAVDVVDGPPTTNREKRGLFVLADQDGAGQIDLTSTWAGQGSLARSEEYDIPCLMDAWTGDTDAASLLAARTAFFADLDTIAALFRSSVDLGLTGYTLRAQFAVSSGFTEIQEANGLLFRIAFTVRIQARI